MPGCHQPATDLPGRFLGAKRLEVAGKIIEDQGLASKIRSHTLKSEALHALFTHRFIREHPGFLECFNAGLAEYEKLHPGEK